MSSKRSALETWSPEEIALARGLAFEPRIPEAAAFAQVNRVLLLRAASGVGLDISLAGRTWLPLPS